MDSLNEGGVKLSIPSPAIDGRVQPAPLSPSPRSIATGSAPAVSSIATSDSSTALNKDNALRLTWSFGFNKDLLNGVHNLTTDNRRAIFYCAANTGVVYDYATRQQTLLQGHSNSITCCIVSEDKRWIVTADSGHDSMIVIWDAMTGNPMKTISQPHPYGVRSIDISPDALFLVTVSALPDHKVQLKSPTLNEAPDGTHSSGKPVAEQRPPRYQQELSVWEWTVSSEPLYSSAVATEDIQESVRFNTYDIREIITNGKQRVIFWNWQNAKLLFYSPSLLQRDFRQTIGAFTQSIFVPSSKQALTGTEDGDVVLWDVAHGEDHILPRNEQSSPGRNSQNSSPAKTFNSTQHMSFPDRKAVKVVRLAGGLSTTSVTSSVPNRNQLPVKVKLTFLTDIEGYLAIGSSDGAVRFYDFDFRLVAWFEDIDAGPITSLSFALTSIGDGNDTTQLPSLPYMENSRNVDEGDIFLVPDFTVATSSAFIVSMSASLFSEHDTEKRRGLLLMQGIDNEINSLACHPLYDLLAFSSTSGVLQTWNYVSKKLIMMRKFETDKSSPTCLEFSHDGECLFVGFCSGTIKSLHSTRLDDLQNFRFSKSSVTHVKLSLDGSLLVAADINYYVGLWRSTPFIAKDGTDDSEWIYIGRCRAHSERITGLSFSQTTDGTPLLVSVSEDKTLVEYDLTRSSIVDGIVLTSSPLKIEQNATPTTCCWYPELRNLKEDLIILANDEYKLKQWNANNKICRKTTLGPAYGKPINSLIPLPLPENRNRNAGGRVQRDAHTNLPLERYGAYSTSNKVVGLMKFPLDGNPRNCMGLVAHPGEISNIAVTYDGKYLISAGGPDLIVNMWQIHTDRLNSKENHAQQRKINFGEENINSGANDDELDAYLTLLEGGRDGELYNDILDYFYYAQLRVQGELATAKRDITHTIPLHEIPNVMRGLGFYPTEREINAMWSEVKYSRFTETSQIVESITLPDFIKLYLNHRPVFGIGDTQIEDAFQVIAQSLKTIQENNKDEDNDRKKVSIRWQDLEQKLLTCGEPMTVDELHGCLDALIVTDDGITISAGYKILDKEYTPKTFADKILGFECYEGDQV